MIERRTDLNEDGTTRRVHPVKNNTVVPSTLVDVNKEVKHTVGKMAVITKSGDKEVKPIRKFLKNCESLIDRTLYFYLYGLDLVLVFNLSKTLKNTSAAKIAIHFTKLLIEAKGSATIFIELLKDDEFIEGVFHLVNLGYMKLIEPVSDKYWITDMSQPIRYSPTLGEYTLGEVNNFHDEYDNIEYFVNEELERIMNLNKYTSKDKETLVFLFEDKDKLTVPYYTHARHDILVQRGMSFSGVVAVDLLLYLRQVENVKYEYEKELMYSYTPKVQLQAYLKFLSQNNHKAVEEFLTNFTLRPRDFDKETDPFQASEKTYQDNVQQFEELHSIQKEAMSKEEEEYLNNFPLISVDNYYSYMRKRVEALNDLGFGKEPNTIIQFIVNDTIELCKLKIFGDHEILHPIKAVRVVKNFISDHYGNSIPSEKLDEFIVYYITNYQKSLKDGYVKTMHYYAAREAYHKILKDSK